MAELFPGNQYPMRLYKAGHPEGLIVYDSKGNADAKMDGWSETPVYHTYPKAVAHSTNEKGDVVAVIVHNAEEEKAWQAKNAPEPPKEKAKAEK